LIGKFQIFLASLDEPVFLIVSYGGSLFQRTLSGLCCFRYPDRGARSLLCGGMAIDFAQWLHALALGQAWCEPILATRKP
jgi:hypothetical protein